MALFVGLGNPGPRHAAQRHNVGFMALDAIARAGRLPPFRPKFQSLASEGTIGGTRVTLLMPQTFMNESGIAVAAAARFARIAPQDIVVLHDELDLPPGRLRVKTGGGNAGHNGLRSITSHLGNDYRRVRIGIGHPGHKDLVHNYVLGDFAKAERTGWVETLCEIVAREAPVLAAGDDAKFQTRVHLAMEAAGVHQA